MRTYTVLLYRDPNDPVGWLGHVPAVPIAHSFGESREHALEMVEEALLAVVEFLFDQGEVLPMDAYDLSAERSEIAVLLGGEPLDLEAVQVNVKLEATVLAA